MVNGVKVISLFLYKPMAAGFTLSAENSAPTAPKALPAPIKRAVPCQSVSEKRSASISFWALILMCNKGMQQRRRVDFLNRFFINNKVNIFKVKKLKIIFILALKSFYIYVRPTWVWFVVCFCNPLF